MVSVDTKEEDSPIKWNRQLFTVQLDPNYLYFVLFKDHIGSGQEKNITHSVIPESIKKGIHV